MKALTLGLKALQRIRKGEGLRGSLATIDFVVLLLETAPAINKVTARKGFTETFRWLVGSGEDFRGVGFGGLGLRFA